MSQLPIAKQLGNINKILESTPELNNCPPELWQQTYEFLKAEGFLPHKFAFMISQNPKLLTIPQEKLFKSINDWRGFQFGERQTITLLEVYPELLMLEHSKGLITKISTLKEFIGGGNNISKLLMKSPAALSQSLPSLNEKIEYYRKVMRVEPHEVYNADAFSRDIDEIKTRHNFLVRLGMFVPKKSKDPNEISKNPNLYLITDTSDKRFATKVCHVTLDEFETFQEMFKKELEKEAEEEESDGETYDASSETEVEVDLGKVTKKMRKHSSGY